MTSFGGIWDIVTGMPTLNAACHRAAKGKMDRNPVRMFLDRMDTELPLLQTELRSGCYCPGGYTQFRIKDPKPRTISCAPFRDRVVHHALCDVCGSLLEKRYISDSYACRGGKGVHAAIMRAQGHCRRYRYFLKADIASFFDSVDHEVALSLIMRTFREQKVRGLWAAIIHKPLQGAQAGKGLPIGNLTSQWLANTYLDAMDHLIKEVWRFPEYVRYMDDFILWCDDKDSLWWAIDHLRDWLHSERKLSLKESALRVAPCAEGLPFLGMRIFPGAVRLKRSRLRRSRNHVRRCLDAQDRLEISERECADSIRAVGASVKMFGMQKAVCGLYARSARGMLTKVDDGVEVRVPVRAPTASTGVAAGTTTPGTAVPRIATGTRRTTGTTTWACASRVRSRTMTVPSVESRVPPKRKQRSADAPGVVVCGDEPPGCVTRRSDRHAAMSRSTMEVT